MELSGKVIVVTGAAGLIGRRFATAIAARGGLPIVTDIDIDAADSIATQIRSSGLSAEAHQLDITSKIAIDDLIGDLRRKFGRLDAVVNSAYPRNRNYGRKLEDVEFQDFCENVNAHLGGYFLVSQSFACDFRDHQGGSIVNMASIYGLVAPRFELYADTSMTLPVEYAAIKAGIIQLTRYFAQYYKRDGIRCNALAPGGVRDSQPQIFLDRYDEQCGSRGMLRPEDLDGALCFLLSDASRYVNGQVLVVDDGFTL